MAFARDDGEVAGGIRFVVVAFVTVAAVASPAAAARDDATGPSTPHSAPAATSRSTPVSQPAARVGPASADRDPAAGFGLLRPSSESGDVTRLLLLLLIGLLMLVVIPTQVAKGVAQRRRQAALATARARRPRRRP
jgi:hypothetical protein